MRLRFIALFTLGCVALLWIDIAQADVIYLESGGKYRGKILKETSRAIKIKTRIGTITVPRSQVSKIIREDDAKATYKKRAEALEAKQDADAWYELGKWAKSKNLNKSARKAWKKAVELDKFHREAREALGHTLHQGRWYTKREYKEQVLGLVKHEGKWVSKEDKERLEAGLVKDAQGRWVLKDGGDPAPARPRPRPRAGAVKASAKRRSAPSPRPRPARKLSAEDKSWYRDNTRVTDWASAPFHESRYYKIKTNVKPEYADRYGKMMDRYYVRFLKVFKQFLPKGEIRKSEIYIYSSQQEFMGATRKPRGVGGFYNTGTKRVTAFHGMFGMTGTTRTVLAHEGTHQFEDIVLKGRFMNCPIWILEGLAVFFESAVWDGKDVVIGGVPRDRLSHLKRGLATGTLIPLTQLIRTPQPQFTAYHYAHAWGLIYMVLYYGKNKAIRKRCQAWFSDLFSTALKQRVTADMVEERCGGRDKFLELEQRWKEWIKDLPYDYKPKK